MSGMIKVTDLGDKVRLQNGGSPTIGVMFDGKFFPSQKAAAKAAGVNAVTFSGQLKTGGKVKGKEASFATIADVKEALPADKLALATKLQPADNKKQKAAVKREAAKKKRSVEVEVDQVEQTGLQPLLEGVRWGDGRVTLVMLGTDFEWKLDGEEDIPWIWQGRVDWKN